MNEIELKELWKSANEKLEESNLIARKNTEDITRIKLHNFLSSMKPIKIFTLLAGIIWVGSGTIILSHIYVYAFSEANKFLFFSAAIQILCTLIALWIYLYQLIKIYGVNIYDPILETQEKLVQLRISTLLSARILFLQLPVWTTFWWNQAMVADWNLLQWVTTISVTLSFSSAALWLFFNIKYENRNKKWFKLIFRGKEWIPLMKSMELLEQVEEYKVV
ncbi:hypothetical protein ACS126_12910 [Sphingobacterium lactis]|uniref:hypothetical protein n=1 Tax=Sphingobacterium lactis TaxID=797291 RepID=UPI003EC5BEB2